MAAAPAARAPTPFRLAAPVDWAGVLVVDAAAALVAELAREEDDDDEAREVAEEAFELTMEEPDEATDEVAAAVVLEPEPEPASTQISVVMDEVFNASSVEQPVIIQGVADWVMVFFALPHWQT